MKLKEFQSISLIGCMYKVLTKLLASRLKKVMQKVISKIQISFLEGRQIEDSILIANELVDDAKRRKREALLFKVNFEKENDSVDWVFLDYMMERRGFSIKWRNCNNECLQTSTISVFVNCSPTKKFYMGR